MKDVVVTIFVGSRMARTYHWICIQNPENLLWFKNFICFNQMLLITIKKFSRNNWNIALVTNMVSEIESVFWVKFPLFLSRANCHIIQPIHLISIQVADHNHKQFNDRNPTKFSTIPYKLDFEWSGVVYEECLWLNNNYQLLGIWLHKRYISLHQMHSSLKSSQS